MNDHYLMKVDFKTLQELKLLIPNEVEKCLENIQDDDVKRHTMCFYENKWDKNSIPDYKRHTCPSVQTRTPFQQCEERVKRSRSETPDPSLTDESFSEEDIPLLLDDESSGNTEELHNVFTPPQSSTPECPFSGSVDDPHDFLPQSPSPIGDELETGATASEVMICFSLS